MGKSRASKLIFENQRWYKFDQQTVNRRRILKHQKDLFQVELEPHGRLHAVIELHGTQTEGNLNEKGAILLL